MDREPRSLGDAPRITAEVLSLPGESLNSGSLLPHPEALGLGFSLESREGKDPLGPWLKSCLGRKSVPGPGGGREEGN